MGPAADTATTESITRALYECISGPAGQPRDWDRQRSLFHPHARLVRTGVDEDGRPWLVSMTLDEYRANAEPLLTERGFHEIEIGHRATRFGNIAHVLSAYEARISLDDPEPERRGVNSIQLYHDGDRWWILHIAWDNEREAIDIPAEWIKG